MKLVIVGGGSSYTPELIDGIIARQTDLPFTEVCLTDINQQRLDILAGLSRRMAARAAVHVNVTATLDRRSALDGADFVNCLMRVGGMDARIQDEKIPLRYNIIGQETTGPGGMMKALRTIPVMLDLAQEMTEVCPDAWLINYTNPSGIVAEALGKHSRVHFIGLCSGPQAWIGQVVACLGVAPQRASAEWLGLNHLGFLTRLWLDGHDATSQAIEAVAGHWELDGDLIRTLGVIPASYLRYFYHHDQVVREAQQPGHRTRGEVVKEMETELLRQYADPALAAKPELLKKRGGGGYADVATAAMTAVLHNKGERQIVQVLNQGAIDDIPADASVEVPCLVDARGAHPLRMGSLPLAVRGLVQAVKAYESLTVQAAVEGSKRLALQALMAHPLVGRWEIADPLLRELLAANRTWIPWAE